MVDQRLRRLIGLADVCELMAATFAFPDRSLAEALVDGTYVQDARACLEDLGMDAATITAAVEPLQTWQGMSAESLFEALRKGHSRLYLVPGDKVPVWPYESPFLFSLRNPDDHTSLFLSPRQKDVEKHMRAAGVMPKNARQEPSDSVWSEFSFLSYLYGSWAAALQEERVEDALVWGDRVASFWGEHASQWLFLFMEDTQAKAPALAHGEEYALLARWGVQVLNAVEADVANLKN